MVESIFFRICSNSPGVAPKLLEPTVCLQICTLFLYLELCVDDYACTNKKRANIYAVELYASFRYSKKNVKLTATLHDNDNDFF